MIFGEGLLKAKILEIMPGGTRKVEFSYKGIFNEILDKIGMMPLPPYIHEELKQKIDIRLFMQNMMDQQQHLQQGCTLHQNY